MQAPYYNVKSKQLSDAVVIKVLEHFFSDFHRVCLASLYSKRFRFSLEMI